MSISVSEFNGIKAYNFSFGKSLPDSLGEVSKKKKNAEEDPELKKKVELIYDFQFRTSSQCLELSNDGNYVVATGIYPPRLKIYDLNQMTLKCERGIDSEIVCMKVLSDDYKKVVLACTDRHIEFHAQYGRHYKVRVPKMPRCIDYNPFTCDLFVAASDSEIYRLNLEEGKFYESLKSSSEAVNKVLYHPPMDLVFAAGPTGILDVFDYRQRSLAAKFEVFPDTEITALQRDGDLNVVLGSAEGELKLFDLRYPAPAFTKTHPYMVPINDIIFHEKTGKMIVSDEKSIRLYDKDTGNLFTTVESKFKINGVRAYQGSGLLLVPQESSRVGTFFIPALGPAPKWCSFVENMTEEMEEKQTETIFNDYKFLSQEEVEKLNSNHLIGTKFLQSYMNGFIMKSKLYNKLKEQNQTFDYQVYKEEQIQKRLDKEVAKDKIFNKQLKARVNSKLIERNEKYGMRDNLTSKVTQAVLKDTRFGGLTEDPDFE